MTPLEAWRAAREEARQMEERHRTERAETHARRDAAYAALISSEQEAIRAAYPDARMVYDDQTGLLKVWVDASSANWRDFSPRPGGVDLGLANESWSAFKKGRRFPTALEALRDALTPYTPPPRPVDDGRPV